MIFLANRENLDKRTVLTRIHNRLQTQAATETAPVEQVWYHTSTGNKVGVRATLPPDEFRHASHPVDNAELQVSFEFPQTAAYDFYTIHWVEPDRNLMLGWHQDDTHMDLGKCHFQIDFHGETVQRDPATFLDSHPLNVFDQRLDDLVDILDGLTWETDVPHVPKQTIQ